VRTVPVVSESTDPILDSLDALAGFIGRGTAAVDRDSRLIGHSANAEGLDPVRIASILNRRVPVEAIAWLSSFGIGSAIKPVRTPPRPQLKMEGRVITPIRRGSMLLGCLVTDDSPRPLTPAEMEKVEACSLLLSDYMPDPVTSGCRQHDGSALELLLRGDASDVSVASRLIGAAGFDRELSMRMLHCMIRPVPDSSAPPPVALLVDAVLDGGLGAASVMKPDCSEAAVLTCLPDDELRTLLNGRLRALAHLPTGSLMIGVSDPFKYLSQARVPWRQAMLGAYLGWEARDLRPAVWWQHCGSYRALLDLVPTTGDVPIGPLGPLLATRSRATLVQTLEVYLDRGGDAHRAATELAIHRTTLYQRLSRIAQITAKDLRDGDDRLLLHVHLRLWRLGQAVARAQAMMDARFDPPTATPNGPIPAPHW
jgi:hypothetical protein